MFNLLFKRNSVARLCLSLISLALFCFAAFVVLAFNTLEKAKINGPLYSQLALLQKIGADYAPPPDYAIGLRVRVAEMSEERDPVVIQSAIKRFRQGVQAFEAGHEYYEKNLPQGPLKDATERVYQTGETYIQLVEGEFIPLKIAGKHEEAEQIRLTKLRVAFHAHNVAINALMGLLGPAVTEREAQAHSLVSSRSNWMIIAAILGPIVIVTAMLMTLTDRARSEERLWLLGHALQSASDCILIADTTDRILYANEAFLRTYEYAEGELIGANSNPQLASMIQATISSVDRRGELWSRSKSGRIFPISLAKSEIKDERGRLIGTVAVARDITHEKEAQTALAASEEKFKKAFSVSPDAISITDIEKGLVEINERFEEVTGYKRSEALGHSLVELNLVEDLSARDVFLARLQSEGSIRDFEFAVRRRDGAHADFIVSAETIEIGERPCFITIARDVTEQKRAEEAARRTEIRYGELVENANDIIFTTDKNLQCRSMNRAGCEVFGYSKDDISGTPVLRLVDPSEADQVKQELAHVLDGDTVPPFEITMVTHSGEKVPLELGLRVVVTDGTAVAIEGIARNISDRKRLELKMRQADKMEAIGRLAGGVAHDFNNLLTVILGTCEIGTVRLVPEATQTHRDFENIRKAAERAAVLTRQLLLFSRMQISEARPVDLNQVIADIHGMLKSVLGEDVALQLIPGDHLGSIHADPSHLQRVLINFAVNARDAMPDGGHLLIETRNQKVEDAGSSDQMEIPAGDYVVLSVSDTGIGMNEYVRARLFDPFFTTKGEGKGTGLGLATVYGIVQQGSAHITVRSEPGRGATFTIYWPRTEAQPLEEPVAAKEETPEVVQQSILLVEDEDVLRSLMQEFLAGLGYQVMTAAGADEALAVSQSSSHTPELLITDVVMPGGTGFSLASELKDTSPELKILYLSGYSDEAVSWRGQLPAGEHFLQKPFRLQELANRVRSILNGGRTGDS